MVTEIRGLKLLKTITRVRSKLRVYARHLV